MTHVTIKRVTEDIETRIQFNTAIAAIMEFYNHLAKQEHFNNMGEMPTRTWLNLHEEALDTLVLLLSPFAPHIADEMWSQLGHDTLVHQAQWPAYQEECLRTDEIEIVIQVNGKVRQKLSVPAGIADEDLKARSLKDPRILEWTQDKPVKKVIVVPKKLVNIVV